MTNNLIIVESPTKARTITRFLDKQYAVKSSMGHIRDLPRKKIGIEIDDGFCPHYQIIPGKKRIVSELKRASSSAQKVIIGTDEDREGEAIAWHIVEAVHIDPQKIERIVFHEITPAAIQHALEKPRSIDMKLVDAQQARRVLDRLVGYKLSPFLWHKIGRRLSAGRVQSVTLRLIVEREEEIEKFHPSEYWDITATFVSSGVPNQEWQAKLIERDGKKLKQFDISDKQAADEIVHLLLADGKWIVSRVETKPRQRNPQPPFITSTLQQEASQRLHFSPKKTMAIAQQLYEGIEVDGTQVGLITYMRTDSTNVASEAQKLARQMIEKWFGAKYIPPQPRVWRTKAKLAQEAHEAIRSTDVKMRPDDIRGSLTEDQYKLYALIWKRFLASQMSSAVYNQTTVDITRDQFLFRAQGRQIVFPGWLALLEERSDEKDQIALPRVSTGDCLVPKEVLPNQHFTEPPPRYTAGTLIKDLEKYGIGRPSTYAPTITTLLGRGYVKQSKGKLYPQKIGRQTNELLTKNFSSIIDIEFTAKMESSLDEIAVGQADWHKIIEEFYSPFEEMLRVAEQNVERVCRPVRQTDEKCPRCGANLVIREGRWGEFFACSNFPKCRYTRELSQETTDEVCEKCGKPMVVKRSRYGKFLACSGYPKCKFTKRIQQDARNR